MRSLRIRFWLLLVVPLLAVAVAACGEPELPDTTGDAVIAYLEEVDYQESLESSGLGWVRNSRAKSRTACC